MQVAALSYFIWLDYFDVPTLHLLLALAPAAGLIFVQMSMAMFADTEGAPHLLPLSDHGSVRHLQSERAQGSPWPWPCLLAGCLFAAVVATTGWVATLRPAAADAVILDGLQGPFGAKLNGVYRLHGYRERHGLYYQEGMPQFPPTISYHHKRDKEFGRDQWIIGMGLPSAREPCKEGDPTGN